MPMTVIANHAKRSQRAQPKSKEHEDAAEHAESRAEKGKQIEQRMPRPEICNVLTRPQETHDESDAAADDEYPTDNGD
jgi:hypothetical protein